MEAQDAVDAGQVWGQDQNVSLTDLRYSTGISISWNSPFGPLKLSAAQPLNNKPGDRLQQLQFQFGTGF